MGLKLATLTPKTTKAKGFFREIEEVPSDHGAAGSGAAGSEEPALTATGMLERRWQHSENDVPGALAVLSWNLSAVNNNPFEYWLSYDDPRYLQLMMGVEYFLDDPGVDDVEVAEVFTDGMFQELMQHMAEEKMEGLDEVEAMWREGEMRFRERHIVTEVIKDKSLGAKRLISMPDRVTNTINVVTRKESHYQPPPSCRPSVMNNFEGDLSTTDVWWEQWKKFMFQDSLTVRTATGIAIQRPVDMLEPIKKCKYPAVTEQEERLSIPLQILCQAIFDVIIVHLMNKLSPENEWQVVKSTICDRLFRNKHTRTLQILADRYSNIEVMCLQEVAAVFKDHFQASALAETHKLVLPQMLDGKRDQNSVICLSQEAFVLDSITEVTNNVAACLKEGTKLAAGDLLAVKALTKDLKPWLIVSFHGDTNGLLTLPLVDAVATSLKEQFGGHTLVLGMDANIYEQEKEGIQGFGGCIQHLTGLGLTTCWGSEPQASACRTTCSARTSLQPQLNKAVRYADRVSKSGKEPKDLIVFRQEQLAPVSAAVMGPSRQPNPMKDNTGHLEYREETVFPTLDFPSDHGLLAVALQPVPAATAIPGIPDS